MCVCGAVGAVTVITPLELVRTKMQSQRVSYSELQVCIRSAMAQGGMLSLWRGWGPTVLRDVPFSGQCTHTHTHLTIQHLTDCILVLHCVCVSAMYWFNYELIKAELSERYRTPQSSFTISFAAGAVSGAVSIKRIRRRIRVTLLVLGIGSGSSARFTAS